VVWLVFVAGILCCTGGAGDDLRRPEPVGVDVIQVVGVGGNAGCADHRHGKESIPRRRRVERNIIRRLRVRVDFLRQVAERPVEKGIPDRSGFCEALPEAVLLVGRCR
jgi:hypothetical protein